MTVSVILFIVGLVCLIFGGDWFVDGAVGIAKKMHVSDIVIGATVVSIGTTLPEVMVSANAAAGGNGGMAYGNAIGSIICNTALICAITICFRPARAGRRELVMPVIFFFAAALIYVISAYFIGRFTRAIGIILLVLFVVYMIINLKMNMPKKGEFINNTDVNSPPAKEPEEIMENPGEDVNKKPDSTAKLIFLLVIGAALIAVGADLLVDHGTIIAEELGVPDTVIALTFVALGTSLPELITAITSLIKKHGSLSLGNIIGANLFNLVLVSGMAITISPFDVPVEKTIGTLNASLIVDIPLMLIVMLLLTLPVLIKEKLYRWQGIVLPSLYAGFCVFQFAA